MINDLQYAVIRYFGHISSYLRFLKKHTCIFRDKDMTIREKRARSIRRQRLGVIEEDEEDGELHEIVFEKMNSLRRSVKKSKSVKRDDIELISFAAKESTDVVTSDNKLLVRTICEYSQLHTILIIVVIL